MTLETYVANILKDIRENGVEALKAYSKKFDGYDGELRVTREEMENACKIVSDEFKKTTERIIKRLESHHKHQLEKDFLYSSEDGSIYGMLVRPLERIGIYVPGGMPLPSTLMMIAIPAKIAGVREMVVTTPPKKGKADPHILYLAVRLGIEEMYKLGGVQAIAAMAFGVGMKKVDKIFGPGNKYVNEAKRQVFGYVGIDSLAGPSEICVVADESAVEEYVKSDLASQREHGEDSRAFLLTTSEKLARYCSSLEGVKVEVYHSIEECLKRANEIAPEHLELMVRDPLKFLSLVRNAGAVYLGPYTPVASADYFLGVNHVLPTGGAARFSSVLNVGDFLKRISVAMVSKEELEKNKMLGIIMAEIEGMKEHRRSLEVRE